MRHIYDNLESIVEGILLFVMILVIACVALIAWPAKEIYDSWGTYDADK